MVDPALLHRYPGEFLRDYNDRARAIEVAYAQTLQDCQRGEAFPVQGHELTEYSQALHYRVFSVGDPAIAGKFRTHLCTFGRPGHEREGTPPTEISQHMRAFHPGYPPVSPEEAGWWGARFLQRFFAIHPFADGNGRIARLLLIWGIEESGDLRVLEDWFACGAEAKYVRALEFAHEHSPNEGRRDDHGKNYLRKLAAWLRGRVAVIGDDLGDEVLEENVE